MTNGSGGAGGSSPLGVALQILGATAGISALAGLVGGATLWVRFDALRLPADQAVAQVPERLLLITGIHAIAASVALAGLAAVGLVLMLGDDGMPRRGFRRVLIAITLLGAVLALWAADGIDDIPQLLIVGAILALGALGIFAAAAARATRRRHVALVVFAIFSLCGGSLAILRTKAAPLLEPTAVLLKDAKQGLAGFYVGQSADRLYIAALPGDGTPSDPFADAEIDAVVEIPREQVVRVATRRPTGVGDDQPGREQAQTLLADIIARQRTASRSPAKPIETARPEFEFAPLAHLHADEQIWPMSVAKFLSSSTVLWAHDKRCDHSFALGRHVKRNKGADADALDKIRPASLGRGATTYAHPASATRCRDGASPAYKATQITRPFEKTGRPQSLSQSAGLREGFYININDDARRGTVRVTKEGAQEYVTDIPIYYERHGVKDRPSQLRITYWLFYGLSQPPGPNGILRHFVHEGDWEGISVLLERKARASYEPISVRYHFHEEKRDVPWAAVRRVAAQAGGAETHPVLYVAKASHASYPRAGAYLERRRLFGRKRVEARDDAMACPACPQWRTWEHLRDAEQEGWYGFGGAWGTAGSSGATSGPLGPSARKTCGAERCPAPPPR